MRRIVPIIVHYEPVTYRAMFLFPEFNKNFPIMAWEWVFQEAESEA